MSETMQVPARGRQPRAAVQRAHRRRRSAGSLDRMASFNLDIFRPEQLDPQFEYRWVNDIGTRMRSMTRLDDWDAVTADEIPDFSAENSTDSAEGDGRIRVLVESAKTPVYAYLLKKRKDFCEEDRAEAMDRREAMMEGRIYRGEETFSAPKGAPRAAPIEASKTYVPPGNDAGFTGRRRGKVKPRKGAAA